MGRGRRRVFRLDQMLCLRVKALACSPLDFSVCVCVILIPRQCSAKRAGPAEKCKHLLPQEPEERKREMEPIAFPWIVSLIWRKRRKPMRTSGRRGLFKLSFLNQALFFSSFFFPPPTSPKSSFSLSPKHRFCGPEILFIF